MIEERHDFALTVAVDLLMASVTCALIVLIAACVVRVAAGVIVAWRGKEKPDRLQGSAGAATSG